MSFSFSKDVVDWWSEQAMKLAPYWELFMGWMTEKQEEDLTYKLKEILQMAIRSRKDCVPTTPPSEIDEAFSCGEYVIGLRGGLHNPLAFTDSSSKYVYSLEELGWFGVGVTSRRSIGAVAIYFKGEIPRVRLSDGRLISVYSFMLRDIREGTIELELFVSGVGYKVRRQWVIPHKGLDVPTAENAELVNALAINEETRRLLEDYINRAIGPLTDLAKYQSIFILY
jgi:hypothetical protein